MNSTRRTGAVLLVVLAMLALFAIVGLSFVFYAESRATSSRIYREAQTLNEADTPDVQQAMLDAFSQLIYDNTDGRTGVFSGLRGHSLARAMYGLYYEPQAGLPPAGQDTLDNPIIRFTTNGLMYSGVGPVPNHNVGGLPIVNFSFMNMLSMNPPRPQEPLYDPERTLGRQFPNQPFDPNSRYIGKNVSSTYPDANDMAIAMVNPVNGQVLAPSLHRAWVFNAYLANNPNEYQRQLALAPPTLLPTNTDWTSIEGRGRIIRPRPVDHMIGGMSYFPYPPKNADGTFTGDVQNLPGSVYPYLRPDGSVLTDATGNPILIPKNDSVWIDIGAPVRIWNGKRIKPLFAFLVNPTNNKVNINSAGNMRGTVAGSTLGTSDSGMGLFPSEVNPNRVMVPNPTASEEYRRLMLQKYGQSQPAYPGVVGDATVKLPSPTGTTLTQALFKANFAPPAYAPFDWDAGTLAGAMRVQLPGQQGTFTTTSGTANLGNSAFALAPRWVAPLGFSRYGNGDIGDAVTATTPGEQLNNPYLWNPYFFRTAGTTGKIFSDSDLRKLHVKWADDTGLSNDTLPGYLAPISWGAIRATGLTRSPGKSPSNLSRSSITMRSNGIAIHNLMPMHANLGVAGTVTQTYTTPLPYTWLPNTPVPVGMGGTGGVGPMPNPLTGSFGVATTDFDYSRLNNLGAAGSLPLLRSFTSNLPPLDLNRPLADYRHPLARAFSQNGFIVPLRPDNVVNPIDGNANYTIWLTNNGFLPVLPGKPTPPAYGGTITLDGVTRTISSLMAPVGASREVQMMSNFAAMRDRQELAKDIFARLVIATGAAGSYMTWNGYMQVLVPLPPVPAAVPPVPTPEYDAMRYLAQLSANIVDYIDGDDIATTFVWNPVNPNVQSLFYFDPTTPGLTVPPVPAPSPNDPTWNFSSVNVSNRVVMGTEKPNLVVNEAYSELTNNVTDTMAPARNPLELRFILELMNPNANDLTYGNESKPYGTALNPQTNPMQNATLFYDDAQQSPSMNFGYYPNFLIDLHQNGAAAMQRFADRSNVLGQLPAADRRIDFAAIRYAADPANAAVVGAGVAAGTGYADANVKNAVPLNPENLSPRQVGPVGTKYRPNLATNPNPVNQGYLVMTPGQIAQSLEEYNPTPWDAMSQTYTIAPGSPFGFSTAVPRNDALTPTSSLVINDPNPPPRGTDIPAAIAAFQAAEPAVVVRRLANPYLRPNDPTAPAGSKFEYRPEFPLNPYLAIDRMENVQINDAIHLAADSAPGTNRTPTPINQRASTIKMHPNAGNRSFTKAMVLTPPPASATPNEAFFRHNGQNATGDPENTLPQPVGSIPPLHTARRDAQTVGADPNLLLTPQGGGRAGFEWLVHLDRPLVNQLELLHVAAVPPHQLTNQFVSGTQATPVLHSHVAAWTNTSLSMPVAPFNAVTIPGNQSRLYRALELLKVKPWSYAMPSGGRVPGKININMVTDPNVLLALADPQSGDFFKAYITDPTPGDPLNTYPFDAITEQPASLNYPVNGAVVPLNANSVHGRLQIVRGGGSVAPVNLTGVTMSAQYDPVTNSMRMIQVPGANDRPFRSLGNAATTFDPAFPIPPRNGVLETALNGVFDLGGQSHPYARQALTRKMYNNLTTTSECFEVYLTVGFFEVLNAGPYYTDTGNPATSWVTPILGKEIYKDNPTDLRARFFAIVDRTNLCIDPSNTSTSATDPIRTRKQGQKPMFTELQGLTPLTPTTATMQVNATGFAGGGLTVSYDMAPDETAPSQITAGTRLRIGFGMNAEWVQVTMVNGFDATTGVGTVTVLRNQGIPTNLGYPLTDPRYWYQPPLTIGLPPSDSLTLPVHPVGSLVTNAQLGNPGPQPNFDPNQPNYKAVMPYLQRLED